MQHINKKTNLRLIGMKSTLSRFWETGCHSVGTTHLRLALSFGTPDKANKKTKERKENEAMALRRPRKGFKNIV